MPAECAENTVFTTRNSGNGSLWQVLAAGGGMDGERAGCEHRLRLFMNGLSEDRLESWKEIAAYLGKGVRTVVRWEKTEGMPVHRHQHERRASVFAYKS